MGGFFSSIWGKLFNTQKEFKILIQGQANAGKTTLLYRLHMGLVVQTQPTIGSNVEEISHKNVKFQAWDLGGQESIRFVWPTYTQGAHAVIFVVDSTDKKNHQLSKAEFYNLLVDNNLKDAKFQIFSNKIDLDEAMSVEDLIAHMNLTEIKDHNWHVQKCSVLNGEGIDQGLDWLVESLTEKKK